MKRQHGTSQYRLNHAKSHARLFVESVQRIEFMWQLSDEGLIDKDIADNFIKSTIEETKRNWEYFESYISYREDMQEGATNGSS
ncbi:hypothetical protein [Oceanobacillus oncorhynchi]|uniref:hypothetical protein n=1 Tax=Oceanobacillus oncorhynchi TaxID=545501 RepID=UPI0025A41309|nr:hypothetical protein [Oceanobacillus oncorhynchi]MDM8098685.1 hypothetical protein [Oceanobacillus oncorhynchi]